jgi:hypothetical protein
MFSSGLPRVQLFAAPIMGSWYYLTVLQSLAQVTVGQDTGYPFSPDHKLRDLSALVERLGRCPWADLGRLYINLVIDMEWCGTDRHRHRQPRALQAMQIMECQTAYHLRCVIDTNSSHFLESNASLRFRPLLTFFWKDLAGVLLCCCNLPFIWPCCEQFI